MVDQYPHTAAVAYSDPGTTLPNGDYQPGESHAVGFKCRAEPASESGYVSVSGGLAVDFSWIVYCEVGTGVLPVGASITITEAAGNTLCSDTLKQFSKGQLNCRLWL